MKLALRVLVALLFAWALYFRFARRDAFEYYLLFGAAAVGLGVYLFRYGKKAG